MALGFLILGPFEVHLDGETLALGGRQQRALLAALTLRANELVSSERLIDELWPEDPPDTADHLVHVYVSRLRKALGDDGRAILVTRHPGYELMIERGQVDLHRFEDLTAAARDATENGRFAEASSDLRLALALWRGPALADLVSESFARADAERLNEQRISATEDLMAVEVAAGSDDLVPELKSLVAQHPLRERLRGFLMVALYREGRQAEALEAYEMTRAILADELGIDPSQELQDLHRRVLTQDPTLRARPPAITKADEEVGMPARESPPVPVRRRAGLIGVAIAAVLAVIVASIAVGGRSDTPPSRSRGSILAFVDARTITPTTRLSFEGSASALEADGGSLWVADAGAGTLTKVYLGSHLADAPASSVIEPVSITAGDGRVWAIDPFAGRITALDTDGEVDPRFRWRSSAPVDAIFVQGYLWVVDSACECVFKIDASSGRMAGRISEPFQGAGPVHIAAAPGAIWVLNGISRSLVKISPSDGQPVGEPITLTAQPTDLAVSGDAIWVSMEGDDLVEKLNLTGTPQGDIHVPGGPSAIVADPGGAWVLTSRGGRLMRLVGTSATSVPLATRPDALGIGDAGAWVSLEPT